MNKGYWKILAGLAGLTMWPAQASADWHRAETPHFIIYSEESPGKLESFARELELFDGAYRLARGLSEKALDEGSKVRIFVVPSIADVQAAMGGGGGVAGFYRPQISGPISVVPRVSGGNDARGMSPDVIFFHEYAHHLMYDSLYSPTPAWLREGFAEFFSTAKVNPKKGTVDIGRAAMHRADALEYTAPVAMDIMLADKMDFSDYRHVSAIYAWGWQLTHYLTFEPSRAGQLDAYIAGLMRGEDALEAARAAFGDLDRLGGELRGYRERQRLPYVKLDVPQLADDAVKIRSVSPGMEQAMQAYLRMQVGVSTEAEARAVVEQVEAAVRNHPGDAMLQRVLAEGYYDLRDYDNAQAAALRAVEIDPELVDAHLYIAKIALARVSPPDSWAKIERDMEEAKKKAEAKRKGQTYVEPEPVVEEVPELEPSARADHFATARRHIELAQNLAPNDPEPHYMFYDTSKQEGITPPLQAVNLLIKSIQLAPYDLNVRIEGARALLAHDNPEDAEILLSAVAYDSHGRSRAKVARAMIDLIRQGQPEAALQVDPADFTDGDDEEDGEDGAGGET